MAQGRGLEPLVVGLRHLHGLVERPLHLRLEPALDGGGDEVGRDDEDQDARGEGEREEGQDELGLEARADDLVPALEGELDQVAEEQDQQEQEDDQVEVEEREDDQVRGERDLRRADAHLEDGGDHEEDEDPADDEQVALAPLLLVRSVAAPDSGTHWLRVGVSRLDCTQAVSSASPVKRAIQELTPPSETSERTRT